jgi:hypothetical protein
MTRAGLEPATYGLKERMLIGCIASLSIGDTHSERGLPSPVWSLSIGENRATPESLGFFWGSAKLGAYLTETDVDSSV